MQPAPLPCIPSSALTLSHSSMGSAFPTLNPNASPSELSAWTVKMLTQFPENDAAHGSLLKDAYAQSLVTSTRKIMADPKSQLIKFCQQSYFMSRAKEGNLHLALRRMVYWLHVAASQNEDPWCLLRSLMATTTKTTEGQLPPWALQTAIAMAMNYAIACRSGCLDDANNLKQMRLGGAIIIRSGTDKDKTLSVEVPKNQNWTFEGLLPHLILTPTEGLPLSRS